MKKLILIAFVVALASTSFAMCAYNDSDIAMKVSLKYINNAAGSGLHENATTIEKMLKPNEKYCMKNYPCEATYSYKDGGKSYQGSLDVPGDGYIKLRRMTDVGWVMCAYSKGGKVLECEPVKAK